MTAPMTVAERMAILRRAIAWTRRKSELLAVIAKEADELHREVQAAIRPVSDADYEVFAELCGDLEDMSEWQAAPLTDIEAKLPAIERLFRALDEVQAPAADATP